MSSNYFSHYSTCMFVGGKIKDVPKEVKFKRKNHGSQTEHRNNGVKISSSFKRGNKKIGVLVRIL